jgi:hypothetical protein
MRGALKLTYTDGSEEYYEVDPVADGEDIVTRLQTFLASPNITLFLESELVIIPSTSIRHISITREGSNEAVEKLASIPGVLTGVTRIVG